MKTLSDDITIKLPTTGMAEGYVVTTIYADGIGVFSGRSYIPGDDSSLYVNVNDIAVQNRGKYDYLKLTDDGVVTTTPLIDDTYGTISYQYRFNRGLIYTYTVNVTKDSSSYSQYEDVLTGYDYPNKDLKPTSMDEEDSSLCRIMQGCDWIYNHDEEIGSFLNLLLPHYPYVATNKYGMGLQLWAAGTPNILTSYELECEISSDVSLGSLVFGSSNSTFITLNDLITTFNMGNIDKDTSIYLKRHGVSGDEFGDYYEGYIYYPGNVTITSIKQTRYAQGIDPQVTYIDRSNSTFATKLEEYRRAALLYLDIPQEFNTLPSWDVNKIAEDPSTSVYYYASRNIPEDTQDKLDEFMSYYEELLIKLSAAFTYKYQLIFDNEVKTVDVPTKYYGTCPVAILDRCYSRYYLAWNDRYGDIVSQPFDGKIEFSESFKKDEMTDYKMRRRIIHNEVQPSWKLNTKWLSEDVYPMYESIFTSPYLLLYDTQTDRSWNVIVTDNKYTEKTYKNQKALFNLEITVEANKSQNYIF